MNLHRQTAINIQEKSNLIWAIADKIREYYKPHEYGKVIFQIVGDKKDFNDMSNLLKKSMKRL